MTDPLLQLLDRLPSGRLDPSSGDRIRARCHAALVVERRRVIDPARTVGRWPRIVMGLGGLYLGAVLQEVLALYGIV
ncbi:MAG TPA: hypothetical protein VKA59_14200 [Vicinamibacterales bacterium]|nr:hypothetical protein [Vicinamibacterales bacterium]